MRIVPTGNAGIGTVIPEVRLYAKGNRIRLESTDGSRTLDLRADGSALDVQSTGAALLISAPGQPTFLNPNGGIGSTQPRTTLQVIERAPSKII